MVMLIRFLLIPISLVVEFSSGRAHAQMHQIFDGSLPLLGGLGRRERRGEKG